MIVYSVCKYINAQLIQLHCAGHKLINLQHKGKPSKNGFWPCIIQTDFQNDLLVLASTSSVKGPATLTCRPIKPH